MGELQAILRRIALRGLSCSPKPASIRSRHSPALNAPFTPARSGRAGGAVRSPHGEGPRGALPAQQDVANRSGGRFHDDRILSVPDQLEDDLEGSPPAPSPGEAEDQDALVGRCPYE